jgi:hypothetical protein
VIHDRPLAIGDRVRVRVTGYSNTTFDGEILA